MDRWQWLNAFKEIGIENADLINMPEEDFIKTCYFLVDAGIAPASYLVNNKKSDEEKELENIIKETDEIKSKFQKSSSYRINQDSASKYLLDQKFDMNDKNFDKKEEKIISEPKIYVWNDDNEQDNEKMLNHLQMTEYQKLLQEEIKRQEKEREEQIKKSKQNIDEFKNQESLTQKKREAMEKAFLLQKSESDEGVPMAVLYPSGKRIVYRLEIEKLSDDLFTLIEGNEEMYNNKDELANYIVLYDINKTLKKGITFKNQGID